MNAKPYTLDACHDPASRLLTEHDNAQDVLFGLGVEEIPVRLTRVVSASGRGQGPVPGLGQKLGQGQGQGFGLKDVAVDRVVDRVKKQEPVPGPSPVDSDGILDFTDDEEDEEEEGGLERGETDTETELKKIREEEGSATDADEGDVTNVGDGGGLSSARFGSGTDACGGGSARIGIDSGENERRRLASFALVSGALDAALTGLELRFKRSPSSLKKPSHAAPTMALAAVFCANNADHVLAAAAGVDELRAVLGADWMRLQGELVERHVDTYMVMVYAQTFNPKL